MKNEDTTLESIALMLVKLDAKITSIDSKVDKLDGEVKQGFKEVHSKLKEHDQKFREFDQKFDQLLSGSVDMTSTQLGLIDQLVNDVEDLKKTVKQLQTQS